jgi:hypothetical protein
LTLAVTRLAQLLGDSGELVDDLLDVLDVLEGRAGPGGLGGVPVLQAILRVPRVGVRV